MTTRILSGTVRHSDGTAWGHSTLRVQKLALGTQPGEVYPMDGFNVTADANGVLPETALAVPETGAWLRRITFPDTTEIDFYLAAGAPISIDEIVALAGQTGSEAGTPQGEFLNGLYTAVSGAVDGQLLETDGGNLALVDAPEGMPEPGSDGLWARFVASTVGSWLQATAVGAALFAAVDAAAGRAALDLGSAAVASTADFDAAGAAAAVAATVPDLATQAQTDAGLSATVFVSPSTLSSYRKILRVLRFGQAVFPQAGAWDGVEWYGGGRKTDTTNTTQNSKMRFITKFAVSDLRLVYANVYDNELVTPNDIVIRAGVELASGTVVPVYFGGKRSVTIEGGGFVISDPVAVKLAAGDYIWPRTYLTVANATDDWPQQRARLYDAGERTERGVGLADMSLSGTIGTGSQYAYGPFAVGATLPNSPAQVVLFGDSIMHGQGEHTDYNNFGFGSRALNGINPYIRLARSGEQASQFAGSSIYIRGSFAISSDYAICNYGINDLIAAASVATLQASLTAAWTLLNNAGVSVYQCTLTPKTSSTDAWATTANQTANLPDEAKRQAINDWIRTTPAPLAGYFETADAVESARNSGLWKAPGYTADGTHPSATGHIAMAAAIDTSVFI